jgi:hypothetical protein
MGLGQDFYNRYAANNRMGTGAANLSGAPGGTNT